MALFDGFGEGALRLGAFIGIFFLMALLEVALPRRKLRYTKANRWLTNVLVGGIDSLVVRLMGTFILPLSAIVTANWAAGAQWGLFNIVNWPAWLEILLAIVLLDMAIYGQHVASHKIPILWRFHQVHHSDVDFDVTTAIRFHPIEIALSMLYKICLVLLLGPAVFAVFLFEVILNGCAMFNHANVKLPIGLDRVIRFVLVTPDMHRVHHSVIRRETDSNYGFSLSIWDRLFRTYIPQPEAGHDEMTIGQSAYLSKAPTQLLWSLMLPFAKRPAETPVEEANTPREPVA